MIKYFIILLALLIFVLISIRILISDDNSPSLATTITDEPLKKNPNMQQLGNALDDIQASLQATNPTPDQLAIRQRVTGNVSVPPLNPAFVSVITSLLDGIACREAQRRHYCEIDFCIGVDRVPGHPIRSFDNGYGMFQLTNPAPNYQEKWYWEENLISTVKRLYPQISYADTIAAKFSDSDTQQRIYFRELISRHNASNVEYYELDGSRHPDICREPVAFTHDAPNTSPLYRQNLENNQGLLQALEMFGKELQSNIGLQCTSGMGRQIIYKSSYSTPSILFVTSCHSGMHQLMNDQTKQTTSVSTLPENFKSTLQQFGSDLTDDKIAGCHGGTFNKNSARRIVGTFVDPDQYIIDGVGRCRNSPTCYVDVDVGESPDADDSCMSNEIREQF